MARILIANADRRFSEILRSVLVNYGHEVVTARTGEEALLHFELQHPGLVLLDLGLLGLPGIEVLVTLRATVPHLPVLLVTGDVNPELESQAREMGVVEVIRKRLKMDVIIHAVHRTLQYAGRPLEAEPVPQTTPVLKTSSLAEKPPRTILVVDDEKAIAKLVATFLEERDYRTQIALSGEAALEMIKKEPPDLVLLDAYMPGINGVEVLRRLKAANSPVSVIMLTASQDEPLLKTALDLGAFEVLSKPVDLDRIELAVMVKLILNAPD